MSVCASKSSVIHAATGHSIQVSMIMTNYSSVTPSSVALNGMKDEAETWNLAHPGTQR